MISSNASDLSMSFVSWINSELRHEVQRREEEAQASRLSTRMKTLIATGLSGISLTLIRLFQD